MAKGFGGLRTTTCAAVLALAGAFAGHGAQAADYTIAAGPEVGTYYPVAGALKLLTADGKAAGATRLVPVATAGAVENLEGLRAKRFDFAIVQADQLFEAFQGRGVYAAGGPAQELRTVLALHTESLALLVRKGVKVKGPADLAGKKVDVGPEGSGGRAVADALITGLAKPVKASGMAMGEAVSALCDKKVDAAFAFVGHPSAVLLDGMTRCKNKLAPVTGAAVDALLAANPALGVVEIPAKMYPGVAKPVPTVGTRAVLVTRGDVDPAAVTAVVKAAKQNRDVLRLLHPALLTLGDDERLRPLSGAVPLHPAAEAVFDGVRR